MSNQKYQTTKSFITFNLARTQSKLNAQATAILKNKAGISLVEWRVIQVLRVFEDASMTQIAKYVQMDKGQLSKKINQMEKNKLLVVRKNKKDQRAQTIKLTKTATKISEKIMPTMTKRQKNLTKNLTKNELKIFYGVLKKIENAAEVREI